MGTIEMKKVKAYIMLAVLAVVSCAKVQETTGDDDPWAPLVGDKPIVFSTGVAQTKASALSHESNFRVFGFYQQGNIDPDPEEHYTGAWEDLAIKQWTPNFMYDEAVTYDEGKGYWTYTPVKYWPNNEENTLTFWAYSPYYADGLTLRKHETGDDYGNTIPGIPDILFTTDGTRDLLVSDLAQDLSYRGGDPADGVVDLLFHHAMCKVDFRVLKNDPDNRYEIVLKSIAIENLYSTATHRQDSEGSRWLFATGPIRSISVYSNDTGKTISKDVATDLPESGQILPMPQQLKRTLNAPVLHVVYTFKLAGSGGEPVEYDCTYPLGDAHTRWEKEKHYTYTIRISPGVPILFTAEVEDWGSEQSGYFVVN